MFADPTLANAFVVATLVGGPAFLLVLRSRTVTSAASRFSTRRVVPDRFLYSWVSEDTLRARAATRRGHLSIAVQGLLQVRYPDDFAVMLGLVTRHDVDRDVLARVATSTYFDAVLRAVLVSERIDNYVLTEMLTNANLLAGHISEIWRRTKDVSHHSHRRQRDLARHRNTPAFILDAIAGSDDCDVRRAVAKNPGTSSETLSRLVLDADRDTSQLAAANPNASEESRALAWAVGVG